MTIIDPTVYRPMPPPKDDTHAAKTLSGVPTKEVEVTHHMGVRVRRWVYEFVGVVYETLAGPQRDTSFYSGVCVAEG